MKYIEGEIYSYRNVKVKLVKIIGARGVIDLKGQEITVSLFDLKKVF